MLLELKDEITKPTGYKIHSEFKKDMLADEFTSEDLV